MIEIGMVIGAIVEMGVEGVWEEAKRRDAVLKVLKRVGLSDDKPSSDFDSVYAYSLIEYGINKPKEVLGLFQQDIIKDSFKCAFEQGNKTIFSMAIEEFLDSPDGQKLFTLDYNPKRELPQFETIFYLVADRARTVPEIRQDHMLNDIHLMIHNILEHLENYVELADLHKAASLLQQQQNKHLSAYESRSPHTTVPWSEQSKMNLPEMRNQINQKFDDVELETLCIGYFPKVYEKLGAMQRKDQKINALLDYCRRTPAAYQQLEQLLQNLD